MKFYNMASAAFLAITIMVIAPESRADRREPDEINAVKDRETKRITPRQEVAVVVGPVPGRGEVLGNIRAALGNAKVNTAYLERDRIREMPVDGLLAYRAIIIAEEDMDGYSAPAMTEYARRGGALVFVRYAKLGQGFGEMAGLRECGDVIVRSGSLEVAGNFLFNNHRLTAKLTDVSVMEARVDGAAVFARFRPAGESRDIPLAWTRAIGQGGVLYWNTDLVARRESFRGFIVQSLHCLCRGFVTGLANAGLMMVDDLPGGWPSETGRGAREGKVMSSRGAWEKGIDELARRFGFNITAYLIMRGREDASRFTGFRHEGVKASPAGKGTLITKKGWELGLHGLSFARGKPGSDAPSRVRMEWDAKFGRGKPPLSCAIPAGALSGTVLAALDGEFPSIKVIRNPYRTGAGPGTGSRYFSFPVITYGFSIEDEMKITLYGEMYSMGIISHSIGPEEYVSGKAPRNREGWARFSRRFADEFELVRADFPWLRWMTASEAYPCLRAYEASAVSAQMDGKIITVHVENGGEPLYFRTRLKPGEQIRRVEGCGLVNIHGESGDIIFKSYGRVSRIVLK